MDRRTILTGSMALAGLATIKTASALPAKEQAADKGPKSPIAIPAGPWTEFGQLQRAGGVLNYAELGPKDSGKPPIILLHRLGGWLSDWRFVAGALAQGRRVIAFDAPGHGGSRWQGPAPYILSVSEMAAMYVSALDEMRIDQVDIIGTSMGGCTAVPLSAYWPERVRKLALLSCALGKNKSLETIRAAVDEKDRVKRFDADGKIRPVQPEDLARPFGIVNIDQIHKDAVISRALGGEWVFSAQRGVGITNLQEMLTRIQAPTLLVYGEHDKAYLRYRGDAEARLKTSQTRIISNSGAFVMQDNPEPTAQLLREWVGS